MLTLDPASACEVCAESFGPGHVPAVIPCGHVFCAQCLSTIVDKTSPRLTPACPLCRFTFTDKTWRLIRVDLGGSCSGSGWSGADSDEAKDEGAMRVRVDAKVLEDKVAQAASKKCSFEEVSALHKEVQDWLSHDPHKKGDPQHASLRLSADLLRAILLNCLAYSESNKAAKTKEANLQTEIDKLNAELRRQRDIIAVKTQENEKLRDELSRLRSHHNISPTTHSSSLPLPPSSSSSASTTTTRPPLPATRSMPPMTPPARPGTSLGFSGRSHSQSSGTSGYKPSATTSMSRSTSTTMSPARSPTSHTSSIPPVPPLPPMPPLPPAPTIPYASLAPSPRASTPAPSLFHRRTTSSAAAAGIQRPSTSMGSHSHSHSHSSSHAQSGSSTRHERWMPTTSPNDSSPTTVRGLPKSGLSRSISTSRSGSGKSGGIINVLQEDD